MKVFKGKDERTYDKARKRLDRVPPGEALSWADTTLWGVQQYLEAYGREKSPALLQEARGGVVALLAAVDSALDRDR